MPAKLSHLSESGQAKMVDIGGKPESSRIAIAKGEIRMSIETLNLILSGSNKKGDVFSTARLAGIMAAKRTSELIPLCHPLILTDIAVELELNPELPGICVTSQVKSIGKTGVEMEALTAVSISLLTIYDMTKAVDKLMIIQNIRLIEKHGGVSGDVFIP
jgi:cyclic pyranopterin phosphate synthase